MTTIEAAAWLGISDAVIRQQIKAGRIAARKVGRDWHLTAEEVARYRLVSARKK